MTESSSLPDSPGGPHRIVIVGAGLAGAAAAEELRSRGYDGDLTVLGAEPHLPYDRPPLSKSVLLGEKEPDATGLHDAGWWDEQRIDVRTGRLVTGLDLGRRVVETGDGEVGYDRLLLATGSEPRRLPVAEGSGARVLRLRTRDDSARLREQLTPGTRLVVVGGGWIGLEVAAAARAADCEVVVVEPQEQPLRGVLGDRVAGVFAGLHRRHGVDLRTGTSVDDVDRAAVRLSDGSSVPADLVVVAIGAAPRLELAERAGLAVDGGVLVDAALRTSDPAVVAAGDIAAHDHPVLRTPVRVEHWDNAREQGKVAAGTLLGGDAPYDRLPYFFTDQYDLGMEYVGHVPGDHLDHVVVRGDLDGLSGYALWHDDGRVLAGMHLNEWDSTDHLRALVGRRVDPARLGDESVPIEDLAGGEG
ncbi:NAD(P)/FAD-dependent oxidoreductase [Nocardioides sp. GCM10027113]|uniref:NAD(P)/FAD-dependent oxidoreductase n=1 Tax=unclassified Nocardioides TaxID=2615069 RepID=UPI00361DAC6E